MSALGDLAIVNRTTETAPKDYTVPGAQQIMALAVTAHINGASAAGSFLPCLQLLDPAGDVLWTARTAGSFAAGQSVDVSWFPRAGGITSSTSLNFAYATGYRNQGIYGDPSFSVTSGSSIAHPFPHVTVSDSTAFSWSTTTNANDTLNLLQAGVYIFQGNSEWENANFFHYGLVSGSGIDTSIHGESPGNAFTSSLDPTGTAVWTVDDRFRVVTSAPSTADLTVFNGDVVARSIFNATLFAIYLGPVG